MANYSLLGPAVEGFNEGASRANLGALRHHLTVLNCWGHKIAAYQCPDPPTGCIRVSVSAPLIDAHVVEAVGRQIAKRGPHGCSQE